MRELMYSSWRIRRPTATSFRYSVRMKSICRGNPNLS
jgi:hypothetical protein